MNLTQRGLVLEFGRVVNIVSHGYGIPDSTDFRIFCGAGDTVPEHPVRTVELVGVLDPVPVNVFCPGQKIVRIFIVSVFTVKVFDSVQQQVVFIVKLRCFAVRRRDGIQVSIAGVAKSRYPACAVRNGGELCTAVTQSERISIDIVYLSEIARLCECFLRAILIAERIIFIRAAPRWLGSCQNRLHRYIWRCWKDLSQKSVPIHLHPNRRICSRQRQEA